EPHKEKQTLLQRRGTQSPARSSILYHQSRWPPFHHSITPSSQLFTVSAYHRQVFRIVYKQESVSDLPNSTNVASLSYLATAGSGPYELNCLFLTCRRSILSSLPENYLLAVRLSLSEGSLLAEFAGTPYLPGNDDPQKKLRQIPSISASISTRNFTNSRI